MTVAADVGCRLHWRMARDVVSRDQLKAVQPASGLFLPSRGDLLRGYLVGIHARQAADIRQQTLVRTLAGELRAAIRQRHVGECHDIAPALRHQIGEQLRVAHHFGRSSAASVAHRTCNRGWRIRLLQWHRCDRCAVRTVRRRCRLRVVLREFSMVNGARVRSRSRSFSMRISSLCVSRLTAGCSSAGTMAPKDEHHGGGHGIGDGRTQDRRLGHRNLEMTAELQPHQLQRFVHQHAALARDRFPAPAFRGLLP